MYPEDYSQSFSPILGKSPKFLFLGTMPGKESLRQKQYYAHPQNLFWKILFTLFNAEIVDSYSDKVKFLKIQILPNVHLIIRHHDTLLLNQEFFLIVVSKALILTRSN